MQANSAIYSRLSKCNNQIDGGPTHGVCNIVLETAELDEAPEDKELVDARKRELEALLSEALEDRRLVETTVKDTDVERVRAAEAEVEGEA